MPFYTFHDTDEGSTVVSQVQSTIHNVCDVSAIEAARNRTLVPHDVLLGYVDLGDGTIQYYFNDEAMQILNHTAITVASAQVVDSTPSDMVNLVSAHHYRPS
jgi:acetolactate synthase small subunit